MSDLVEELRITADDLTRHTNSQLDGLLSAAADRIADLERQLAALTAQQVENAEREYLNELDFAQLFRFNEICEDSDADGHDLPKEDVKRLCELGVLRSIGFGRHEITAFGTYVIEHAFLQNPKLPLKTTSEHNAGAALQAGKEKEHGN